MRTARTRWLDRLAILSSLILVIFLSLSFLRFKYVARPFDEKIWKFQRNDNNMPSTRGKMADDLINRVIKKGMTKTQVIKILGSPDRMPNKSTVQYNLGFRLLGNIDPDVLEIDFDKSNRVTMIFRYSS